MKKIIKFSAMFNAFGILPIALLWFFTYDTALSADRITSPLKPAFNKSMNTDGIYSIALNNDGRYMAIGRTNLVELWDTLKGGEGKTIESPGMRDIISMQFSPDGRFLAVGGYKTIEVWSVFERTLFKRYDGYGDYITALTFSPDGRYLAAGSRGVNHSVRVWEVDSGRALKTLEWDWRYADEVKALAFSNDGLSLASVAMDRVIRIWDLRSGVIKMQLNRDRKDAPVSLSLSPDGDVLASGTAEGHVVLWGMTDGTVIRRLNAHNSSVPQVEFSKDGKTVISAGIDSRVSYWDVLTGIQKDTKSIDIQINKLRLARNGKAIAAYNNKGVTSYRLTDEGGLPPVIAILTPVDQQTTKKPEITVSVKIVDDTGISDAAIELNGVEIQGGDAGIRDLKIKPAGNKRELDLSWYINLKRGLNKITVVAYDTENLEARKSIEVNYAEEHGEIWGAVIGISQYQHIEGLRYADKDARAVYDYLTKDNGIPENHIAYLANEDATLTRIKKLLGVDIKQKARKQDTVIIYLAGHGTSEPDSNSPDGDGMEKYFLTYDSDPESLYATALPMKEMSQIFSRIEAERIILIQDTCYSGASGGRTIQVASVRAPISDAYLNRIIKGKGRVVITASRGNEVSMEKDSLGHGVFTYYVLEAFREGDKDHDGLISHEELFNYVSEKVPQETGRNQHPVKYEEEVEEPIVIGRKRGE